MTKPRRVDYLQHDEVVSNQTRRHALSAMDGFLAIVIVWVLLAGGSIVFALIGPDALALNGWTVAAMLSVAAVWVAVLVHWRRSTSLYTVTPERVYMAYGRLRFHLLQTTHDKITDMHVHQSIFGRIWGYGTVRVQTAGTGLSLAGVIDPLNFKRAIEEQRRAFIAALAGKMGATSSRPAASLEAPETQWIGRPSGTSLVGGLLGAAFTWIIAAGLFLASALFDNNAWIGGTVASVAGVVVAWSQWIVFRYTQYEVTDRGVVVSRGWLTRRRVEATFAKVTDVSVVQDLLGRILGYGRITINTAGSNEAPVAFVGIGRPDQVKAIIDAARGAQ